MGLPLITMATWKGSTHVVMSLGISFYHVVGHTHTFVLNLFIVLFTMVMPSNLKGHPMFVMWFRGHTEFAMCIKSIVFDPSNLANVRRDVGSQDRRFRGPKCCEGRSDLIDV